MLMQLSIEKRLGRYTSGVQLRWMGNWSMARWRLVIRITYNFSPQNPHAWVKHPKHMCILKADPIILMFASPSHPHLLPDLSPLMHIK